MDLERYPSTLFGEARRTIGRHGYVAYFPAPIPRRLDLPASTVALLADAEASLGRLAGVGQLVPNPELLIRPYLLREALSSTRIEGTQATMAEIFEVDAAGEAPNPDVEEVLNYIDAMEWALSQLERMPLSARLLREMHRRLMAGVRGRERAPGELRTSQNWIGAANSTVEDRGVRPATSGELAALMTDWERFANEEVEDADADPERLAALPVRDDPSIPRWERAARAAAARVLPDRPRADEHAAALSQLLPRARASVLLPGAADGSGNREIRSRGSSCS